MVTLNPVTIYDNIEIASKISKELPGMQCRIGGIIEGEREKTRISLRKLGKLKCSIYSEDSTYNKLLNIIRKFSIPEDFSFQINGVDYPLPNIQKSDKCLEVCNTATAIAKGTFQLQERLLVLLFHLQPTHLLAH